MRRVLDELSKWLSAKELKASWAKLDAMLDELRTTGTTKFWR